jgi:voltage-gated potassium channel
MASILDADHGKDKTSHAVDVALITLISLNICAVMLASITELSRNYHHWFYAFELFSISIFTTEYILRVWSSPDIGFNNYADNWRGRLQYMLSPLAIIDLLAIAPFFLSLFFTIDLRFLRVVRLVRIFKLTRYFPTLQVLLSVLYKESLTLGAAFFVLIILLIITSSGIYFIEQDVQPEVFGSIPAAMWWSMATLTTVGYGDVVPVTTAGKIFGGCITIIGMGMVAMPAAILASGFTEELRYRRDQYQVYLKEALKDGAISDSEAKALERVRRQLGVSTEEADLLYNLIELRRFARCPHCHKPLDDSIHAND